jgi:hypothetical protein
VLCFKDDGQMNRISATAACLAAFSLLTSPAAALDLPLPGPAQVRPGYDAAAEQVENRRRGSHRYRHRDNGIDAGDVIAGVLILGGIAAIASAASQSRDQPEPYPSPDAGYGEPGGTYRSAGMDRAVDMCVAEIERGRDRVAGVDSASRSGEGWFVSGEVEGGTPFTCRIDNDGRIGSVELGDGWYDRDGGDFTDNQYDDDTYAQARAAISTPIGSAYPN